MHVLIVYNPNAGMGKALRHAERLRDALLVADAATEIAFFAASSLEVMSEFWHNNRGNPEGHDTVVIIGGDGTLGPNVSAMIKNDISVPIYAYGRGTANDFATHFKTNCSPRKAAAAILKNNLTEVDTLKVNEENFAVNVACGGAFTNGVTKYNKKTKRMFGKFAYLVHGLFGAFRMKSQPMRFTVVTSDDGSAEYFDEEVFLFYVVNTKNVGGLRNSAPLADPSDGLLDLVCIKKCGLFGKIAIKINQGLGRLDKCKNVTYIKGTRFSISHVPGHDITPNFTLTDLDGNAGEPYPMEVTLGPKIKVVVR